MPEAFVGIGSNVEPARNIDRALRLLARRFGSVACSPVYQSAAIDGTGADYLNLVVRFQTEQGPPALKQALAELEQLAGRDRADVAHCVLDLDLLLYGQRVDAECRLPRADVLRRPFVLAPLAALDPDLVHPVTGETLGEHWRKVESAAAPALVRVATPAACG